MASNVDLLDFIDGLESGGEGNFDGILINGRKLTDPDTYSSETSLGEEAGSFNVPFASAAADSYLDKNYTDVVTHGVKRTRCLRSQDGIWRCLK